MTFAPANPSSTSTLVIGAGVIGLACAVQLRRHGFDVTLIEADAKAQAASWGNAGHLASEQVAPLASPSMVRSAWRRRYARGGALDLRDAHTLVPWLWRYLRASTPNRFHHGETALRALLAHALPAWHRLAAQLGDDDLVREAGHIVVWETERSTARGSASWRAADTGSASCLPLPTRDREQLAQQLALPVDGIRFSGTGQIRDLPTLAQRLRAHFAAQNGMTIEARVHALCRRERQAAVVLEDGRVLRAEHIVICAGVRSDRLMRSLGEPAPLIAERGYHVQWSEHSWPEALPPVVFEDRSIILTRFDSGLRLAGFVEFARLDTPPDAGKWMRLEGHAQELGLPVRGEATRWMGARPTLPDYLPAIGRSRTADNVFYAFGHQHLGLTLAPISAEAVAALIAGQEPPLSLTPFDLRRFQRN